jgi:hypothetical protein
LASARIIGRSAMPFTISCFSTPPADRPRKMSAPSITSASVRVGFAREPLLVRVHQLGAALVDHAGQVGHPDVLERQADVDQQIEARERGRAGADATSFTFLMSLPTTFRPL